MDGKAVCEWLVRQTPHTHKVVTLGWEKKIAYASCRQIHLFNICLSNQIDPFKCFLDLLTFSRHLDTLFKINYTSAIHFKVVCKVYMGSVLTVVGSKVRVKVTQLWERAISCQHKQVILTIWTNSWCCAFQHHFLLCNISLVQLENENTIKKKKCSKHPKIFCLFCLFFSFGLLESESPWNLKCAFVSIYNLILRDLVTKYYSVFLSLYAHWIHCISCIHNTKKEYFTEFSLHFSQRYRSSLLSFWHLYI